MSILLKAFYLPLAIIACTGAGSIFAELNNFLLFESKYNLSLNTVEWFSFAVNGSVLFGLAPSYLYSKYGVKKTIFIGGILLTAAHIMASFLLVSDKTSTFATAMLFAVGVIGGQGACIIFISALSSMIKFHTIICTHLINGLLWSYFLGSDTFHLALKNGVLPEVSLSRFLQIIAVTGMLSYAACAIIFTKKDKDSASSTHAKGMVLKRIVQVYHLVLAAYLGLVFLLLVSFSSNTYWGSRVLVIVLAINLLLPVITFSLMNPDAMKKSMGEPSETDKFMLTKGKKVSLKEAKNKRIFWLAAFTFTIIIGISRMINDNSVVIAMHNQNTYNANQRSYQMFEVFGAFLTGIFLSILRVHINPYAVLCFYAFLLVSSQVLMFFISLSSMALYVAVIIAGFASGGTFTLMGIIAHEDYGPKHFAKILGTFMTAAAVGILIFDEIIFDMLYKASATENDYQQQKNYGKWNKFIFIATLLGSVMGLITSFGAYLDARKGDGNKDKVKEFIKF